MKLSFTKKAVKDYEGLTLKLQDLVDKQLTKRYTVPFPKCQKI